MPAIEPKVEEMIKLPQVPTSSMEDVNPDCEPEAKRMRMSNQSTMVPQVKVKSTISNPNVTKPKRPKRLRNKKQKLPPTNQTSDVSHIPQPIGEFTIPEGNILLYNEGPPQHAPSEPDANHENFTQFMQACTEGLIVFETKIPVLVENGCVQPIPIQGLVRILPYDLNEYIDSLPPGTPANLKRAEFTPNKLLNIQNSMQQINQMLANHNNQKLSKSPLPTTDCFGRTILVNNKQYPHVIKRIEIRKKLVETGQIPKERVKEKIESRQQHALRRKRGEHGQFEGSRRKPDTE